MIQQKNKKTMSRSSILHVNEMGTCHNISSCLKECQKTVPAIPQTHKETDHNDKTRIFNNYNRLIGLRILKQCIGCNMGTVIVPIDLVNNTILQCSQCSHELCLPCAGTGSCSLCRGTVVPIVKTEKLNWDKLVLPCINLDESAQDDSTNCRQFIKPMDYYNHILVCNRRIAEGICKTNSNEWDNEADYTGENPILTRVRALQAQRQEQILANRRARRQRHRARVRNGTTFRDQSSIFTGNTRPG